MIDINELLKDIASNDSQESKILPKQFTRIPPSNETLSPNDRVIWTAANSKNEIIAEHNATVIRITKGGQIYIKCDTYQGGEGFYRYVSKNRLRRIK